MRGTMFKIKNKKTIIAHQALSFNLFMTIAVVLSLFIGGCSDDKKSTSGKKTQDPPDTSNSQSCFIFNADSTEITGYLDTNSAGLDCPKDIDIPEEVTSIKEGAFRGKGLTSVTLPDSLTSIEKWAFVYNDLTSLSAENVVIEDIMWKTTNSNCFEFDSTDTTQINNYYDHENNDVNDPACPRDVILPTEVTSIAKKAFFKKTLTSALISENITNIGSWAFIYNNLTAIESDDITIEDHIWKTTSSNCFEFDPTDTTQINNYHDHENNNANDPACPKHIVLPEEVTSIGDDVFLDKNLTSIFLPEGLTYLGEGSFKNNSLTSITIPDSIDIIRPNTFQYNRLISLVISDNVTVIGTSAFNNNSLTSVIIGSGIVNATGETRGIGTNAFSANTHLTYVCIEAAEADITLSTGAFPTSVTPIYETDGDCFD